jgi:hypothetical protein
MVPAVRRNHGTAMNLPLHQDALALRLPAAASDSRRRLVGDVLLSDGAVAEFNALLAHLDPQAPRISADQIVTLARWLQAQPPAQAAAIVGERLGRAEQLRRMLADGDWAIDSALADRAGLLVGYLQRVDDLIPDDQPLVGHLDDALLVELSWRSFRAASLDYGDFCRFRTEERPGGNGAERVQAWENACLAEVALLQQRRLVRGRRYAACGELPERMRVV